jgi:hypothetical protein
LSACFNSSFLTTNYNQFSKNIIVVICNEEYLVVGFIGYWILKNGAGFLSRPLFKHFI